MPLYDEDKELRRRQIVGVLALCDDGLRACRQLLQQHRQERNAWMSSLCSRTVKILEEWKEVHEHELKNLRRQESDRRKRARTAA